jgi:two-component response regulator (ARR-B family)
VLNFLPSQQQQQQQQGGIGLAENEFDFDGYSLDNIPV